MAGALIRELHEASYRRLALELLAHADDLPTAEQAVRDAFADAYRRGRTVENAVDPIAALRDAAVASLERRRRHARLRARIHLGPTRRPSTSDRRLLPESRDALVAVTRLPRRQRAAVVLHNLADLPLSE